MNTELVKERLLEATGKKRISLTALATKIKRNRTYFRDFMAGKKKSLSYQALVDAAAVLGMDAQWLSGSEHGPATAALDGPLLATAFVPVYRQSWASTNGRFSLGEQIDTRPWPSQFGRATSAYAFMIAGEAMEPRYDSGDILYVERQRPPRLGNRIIVCLVEGDTEYLYLGRYVSMGGDTFVIRTGAKDAEVKLDRSKVKHFGVIRLIETA